MNDTYKLVHSYVNECLCLKKKESRNRNLLALADKRVEIQFKFFPKMFCKHLLIRKIEKVLYI